MTIRSGNIIAVATLGIFHNVATAAAAPAAPVITASVVGDDVTVAITGTALATHTVYYRKTTAAALTAATPRVGDGNVVLSSLAAGSYYIIAQSSLAGVLSVPGDVTVVRVLETTAAVPQENADELLAAARLKVAAFGESVTYIPYGGVERDIRAIVKRRPLSRVEGTKQGVGPVLSVFAVNAVTDGISAAEFVKSQDKIRLAVNLGETPQARLLINIISQDEGMLGLEVR